MKILIVGATGFIGSKLLESMILAGHEVQGVGRKIKEGIPNSVASKIVECDLGSYFFGKQKYDVIINACALIADDNLLSWQDFSSTNVSVLERIITESRCSSLIHLSTCSIYSEQSISHGQPDPQSMYGLSKYVSEKLILLKRKKGVNSIIVRFPIVIGNSKPKQDIIN